MVGPLKGWSGWVTDHLKLLPEAKYYILIVNGIFYLQQM